MRSDHDQLLDAARVWLALGLFAVAYLCLWWFMPRWMAFGLASLPAAAAYFLTVSEVDE